MSMPVNPGQFDPGNFHIRFDILKDDAVRIAGYHFGHNKQGSLDVWIETTATGSRFSSQIVVPGETHPVNRGVSTGKCYILRDKTTARFYFLDMNDCGFWLHTESFSGARAYFGAEAAAIQKWLESSDHLGLGIA